MSAPTRIAVVGLGKMGIMHSAMVSMNPAAELVAICDRDAGLGRHVASMGVRAPFFTSVKEMMETAKPEGVIVSVPQFAHAEVGLEIFNGGAGILVEKPLAHTLEQAREMRDVARGRVTQTASVAFMLAFHPIFRLLHEYLQEGAIGTLRSYEAVLRLSQVNKPRGGWIYTREKSGGGALINSGSHLLYLLHRFFGMPQEVNAESRKIHSVDVEDEVKARLRYEHGFEGTIDVNWAVVGHPVQAHSITITGEQGTISASDRQLVIVTAAGRKLISEGDAVRVPFTLTPHYHGHGYYDEVADFVACFRGEKLTPEVGFDEAYAVQTLLEALYRSSAKRETVALESIE